jgi:hypothetical protein
MKKLKHSEIPEVRNLLLEYQDGIDPITKLKITDPVLDHQHDGGFVRATLQREVNAFEGKVFNAYKRYIKHLDVSLEETLIGLMEYWQMDYSENPIHPAHKTETDKLIRLYRKRIKTAKRESTKQKYRDLIKELSTQ